MSIRSCNPRAPVSMPHSHEHTHHVHSHVTARYAERVNEWRKLTLSRSTGPLARLFVSPRSQLTLLTLPRRIPRRFACGVYFQSCCTCHENLPENHGKGSHRIFLEHLPTLCLPPIGYEVHRCSCSRQGSMTASQAPSLSGMVTDSRSETRRTHEKIHHKTRNRTEHADLPASPSSLRATTHGC